MKTNRYRVLPVENSTCALVMNGKRLRKDGGFTILVHEQLHDSDDKLLALEMTVLIDLDDDGWNLAEKNRGKSLAGALVLEFEGEKFPIDRVDSDGANKLWLWAGDGSAMRGMRQLANSKAH